MNNQKPKSNLSIFDLVISAIFIALILVSNIPFLKSISISDPSTISSTDARRSALQQIERIYVLSKQWSLANSLLFLEEEYLISTEVNYTTLTKKDILSETSIKMTQNFPTKGMTKIEIKVDYAVYIDSNSTSEIKTILFFR